MVKVCFGKRFDQMVECKECNGTLLCSISYLDKKKRGLLD